MTQLQRKAKLIQRWMEVNAANMIIYRSYYAIKTK
jgi:hypothetical protein